ncbi:hypothetical protein HPB50_019979 [Hyalomma asiaticum]|uniref:Uncharacterized protein n=1 Tax=Hyalomma asiaticum TaxID=266040 RepID=A0ACB7SJE5_HYAAI|nr:hypothetical protein HPB50_019979 [Hyalomma asiaticum]
MSVTQEDYTATLCQKDHERYEENTRICVRDPFTLRAGDCVSEVDCGRASTAPIFTNSRSEDESYYSGAVEVEKALEGHNFVTNGWVRG